MEYFCYVSIVGLEGQKSPLNNCGIRLKVVVSIEPLEPKRLRQWRENSDHTRELVQLATLQKLSSSKLWSLIHKFGITMATAT